MVLPRRVLALLGVALAGVVRAQVSVILDGSYCLFNLTKLYLPVGVGFSYGNISANPSAFLSGASTRSGTGMANNVVAQLNSNDIVREAAEQINADLVNRVSSQIAINKAIRDGNIVQKAADTYVDYTEASSRFPASDSNLFHVVRHGDHDHGAHAFFLGQASFCPDKLELTTSSSDVKFPDGLKDSSDTCKAEDGFVAQTKSFTDAGAMLGTFFADKVSPTYISPKTMFRFMQLPSGAMKCPTAPANAPPFAQLSINYIAQQLVSIIKASGIAMKIPLPVMDRVFGQVRQMSKLPRGPTPKGFDEKYLKYTTKSIRDALGKLKGNQMMVLKADPRAAKKAGFRSLECYYVKCTAKRSLLDISMDTEAMAAELVPLMVQSAEIPMKVANMTLYASDSRCGNANDTKKKYISSIKFPSNAPMLERVSNSSFGGVEIDGKTCASAEVTRYIEVEPEMSTTQTYELGKKMAEFFTKNTRYDKLAEVMLSSILKQLQTLGTKDFAKNLQEAVSYRAILYVKVDVSSCELQDKSPITMMIVPDYSVSGFFCKGFPGGPSTKTPLCDSVVNGGSAFVFRDFKDNKDPKCLFSTEKAVADKFLAVDQSEKIAPPSTGNSPGGDTKKPMDPKPGNKTGTNSNSGACFPATSTVRLENGQDCELQNLKIGDLVEVSPNKFEPVLMFTHATNRLWTNMRVIKSASGTLISSPSHMVYKNGGVASADTIRVGDIINVQRGAGFVCEIVNQVHTKRMMGLYNPQTASGNILVRYGTDSAVLATTYTTALSPAAAHSLLGPLRMLYDQLGLLIRPLSAFCLSDMKLLV